MKLNIRYEKQTEYKLEQLEGPKAEVTFRVERMKLSKDKTEFTYNDFFKLRGIPAVGFAYRLGNRSAFPRRAAPYANPISVTLPRSVYPFAFKTLQTNIRLPLNFT